MELMFTFDRISWDRGIHALIIVKMVAFAKLIKMKNGRRVYAMVNGLEQNATLHHYVKPIAVTAFKAV